MHAALAEQGHRPWEIPVGPWVWRQSWCDLAFLHWAVPADLIKPHVPRELNLQQFDGRRS